MITNSTKLGGKLVGLGKVRKNGEMEFNWLEKPIKNRIVNSGLNYLLSYPDNNSWFSNPTSTGSSTLGWRTQPYSSMSYLCGPLWNSSIGTDATPTSFTDTALKAEVGGKSISVLPKGGYTGSQMLDFGVLNMRVTHNHNAVSQTTSVREIGWFGGTGGAYNTASTNPVMFSRVVLDQPVVLQEGEQLVATYQLDETWAYRDETPITFFGLTDAEGNPLKAVCRINRNFTTRSDSSGAPSFNISGANFPYIDYSGSGSDGSRGYNCYWTYTMLTNSNSNTGPLFYSTSPDKTFPAKFSADSGLTRIGTSGFSLTSTYTQAESTNKYRDIVFTLGEYSPDMSSQPEAYKDIHYLHCLGTAYRFGYYDENETWVPQALRKYANQVLTLTFRERFITDDTTLSD